MENRFKIIWVDPSPSQFFMTLDGENKIPDNGQYKMPAIFDSINKSCVIMDHGSCSFLLYENQYINLGDYDQLESSKTLSESTGSIRDLIGQDMQNININFK